MRLIFATQNQHKRDEVQAMAGRDLEIVSLHDLHFISELPETHETLQENALEKALFVRNHFSMDCFSEDTGLEVESLRGAPGVHSARYAGDGKNAQDNIARLLYELRHHQNRKARFRTVICLLLSSEQFYFEGIINGNIALKPSGNSGFGYDPVFIPEGSTITFAEMNQEEKNSMSHRRLAIEKMVNWIKGSMQ